MIGKLKVKENDFENFVKETIYACNLVDEEELDNNNATWMKDKTRMEEHAEDQGYWQVVMIGGQGEFPGVAMTRSTDPGH